MVVLKFYFGSQQACVDAKAIFDGKNANLVAANPSGYMAHPLTIQDPHGGAMHNLESRIRKEKIPVPFFNMSKGPACLLPRNSTVCLHIVSSNESIYKAHSPHNAMLKNDSYPHARFLRFLTPHNPEPTPSLYSTREQHQEGLISLQQAIACAIQHGNQRLQQRKHRSVLRLAIYVRQIICTPSSRVQIIRSISSRWRLKCPRVATAPNGPIRHGFVKLLSFSVNCYHNTTKVEVDRWVWVPIRKGGLGTMSTASKLFCSMSGTSHSGGQGGGCSSAGLTTSSRTNQKSSRENSSLDNTSDSHNSKKQKNRPSGSQSSTQTSTAVPTHIDFKCVTININGFSEEKWKYILSLPIIQSVSVIILTEHHLSRRSVQKK